jgi:hypothetical protein
MTRLTVRLAWLLFMGLGMTASGLLPERRGGFPGFVSPGSMPWGRRAYGAQHNTYAQPRVASFGRGRVVVMQSKDYYDILGVGRSATKQVSSGVCVVVVVVVFCDRWSFVISLLNSRVLRLRTPLIVQ